MKAHLRPLSFSEMLDRAFTLSLRTFPRVGAVVVVAVGAGYGFVVGLAYIVRLTKAPAVPIVLAAGAGVFAIVIGAIAAVLSGLIDAYVGRRITLRRMLSDARCNWVRLGLLQLLIFAVFVVPFAIVAVLFVSTVRFFVTMWYVMPPAGAMLVLAVAVPFVLAVFAGYGFLSCLAGVANAGCVAEWSSAIVSWQRAWERCVPGGRSRRTFAYGALVVFAGAALSLSLQLAGLGVQQLLPGAVVFTFVTAAVVLVSNLAYAIFQYALFVVYYFDLRVRLEGFDLAFRSDSLEAPRDG